MEVMKMIIKRNVMDWLEIAAVVVLVIIGIFIYRSKSNNA
jgi:hypothetical protein